MARTKYDEKRAMEAKKAKQGDVNVEKSSEEPAGKKPRKKRRDRKRWAREVKRYQKPLPAAKYVPFASFKQLVKEIVSDVKPGDKYRLQPRALKLLHEVSVDYLGDLFKDANAIVVNRSGHTLRCNDMKLAVGLMNKNQRRFSTVGGAV